MTSSNVFWSVLAVLLGGGCIYYLFQWGYLRKVHAHQEKLKALYMLAEGLIPTEQPRAILGQISSVIPVITDASHCSIWILNPASQKLEYGAGTDKPLSNSISLSAISGVVTCFRNQALTEVSDAEDCPFVDKETVRRLKQKSLLYVPILADRVCLGVIEVEDRRRKRIFPNEQKAAVEHVAKLAALALWQRAQNSLKDQVHRTEKMATMGEFIEAISNELVGPLTAILGLIQKARGEQSLPAVGGTLEIINREARQASEALGRLLKFAKPQSRRQQVFDFVSLLQQLTDRLRPQWKQKGLTLRFEPPKLSASITADPDHLQEICLNVFRHAERLLEGLGGSTLEVFTDVLDREVLVSLTPGGSTQSGGSGRLPDSQLEDDDEDEDDEESGGLGLSVCRSLLEGAGGALRVDQASSRGFRVEIEYPLAQDAWSRPASEVHETEVRRPKIAAMALVIDDDRDGQDTLLQYLTDRGHRVVVAETLEEGIDLAERVNFDWLFSKIQFGRLSGLEIYTRLRGKADKFVFLAEPNTLIFNDEMFTGEDRFMLRKPIKAAEVEQLLEVLEARQVAVE
jgi:signal transduction histidine kinase/CheY-like chemotaxis protein